jgi:uncharacterized membrane protein HdeD (DUF308 family)
MNAPAMNTPADSPAGRIAGFSTGWSILLLVLGFLSLALPFAAGIAIATAVAILIVCAGIIHLGGSFATRTVGGFLWRLLVGGVYLIAGVYLLIHPGLNLLSLTLLLAVLFFVEGIFHIGTYFHLRGHAASGWILFDGIITIVLALLIWQSWPSSAVWAIGTLVGINLLMSGFTRLMFSRAIRGAPGPAL